MNIDGVELQHHTDTSPVTMQRPPLRSWLSTALALVLSFAIGILGMMLGLTLMLIMLGLAPIALAWFWYVTRDASGAKGWFKPGVAVDATTMPATESGNSHENGNPTGSGQAASTNAAAPTHDNKSMHP